MRHTCAAVPRQARAEKAERGHLRHELGGKFALAVVLFDDRQNLLVYKPSHRLPREPLFVRQQGIEVKEIDSEEWGHRISPLTIADDETQRSTERATLAVRFGRAGSERQYGLLSDVCPAAPAP